MDTLSRTTAALHIATGVLGGGMMLIFGLGVHWLGPLGRGGSGPEFGTATVVLLALFMATEVGAGIALLKGSRTARVVVIVLGVVELLYVPIGTAIGIYTLWALLGKRPAPSHHIEGRP